MEKITKRFFKTRLALAWLLILSSTACHQTGGSKQETDQTSADSDYVAIFDGKTLAGWEGDTSYWRVEDGKIIGERKASDEPLKRNTFLIWKDGQPADFELELQYKISSEGNSGVNYRSERISEIPFALKGYQADIDGKNKYTGQLYEERKRTTLAYRGQVVEVQDTPAGESKNNAWTGLFVKDTLADDAKLRAAIKENDWNTCHIVAKGNRLQHYINGVLMSEVLDDDQKNRRNAGLIGVQIHVGPPMKVEFKDIKLKTVH
ncbi:DUF1080 domain-containing protein [Olivibacter sp. CPCC 100613]|uniref:3-keto-disaccharide hydrolase n=1 Tax=Olivibacter sp. CPCC 100613 TaxID=3079931 RepID=UPI002FF66441